MSHSPSLTELFLGESDSLFCVTSIIRPPVSAAWEFQSGNSKPVQRISKNKTRELADAAKLELTIFLDLDGRKEDNGTYLCIFRNVFGSVSTEMNVIVKCELQMPCAPQKIIFFRFGPSQDFSQSTFPSSS